MDPDSNDDKIVLNRIVPLKEDAGKSTVVVRGPEARKS